MKKREFLKSVGLGSLALGIKPLSVFSHEINRPNNKIKMSLIFPDKQEIIITEEGLVIDDDNMVEAPLVFEVMLRLSEAKDKIEQSANPLLEMLSFDDFCPIGLLNYHSEVNLKFSINGEDLVNHQYVEHPFKIQTTILSGACRVNV